MYRSNERIKYFFKNLTEDKAYANGSIVFEQGYINEKLISGLFNISIYKLPLDNFMSGWKLQDKGIYFNSDLQNSIKLVLNKYRY